MPTGFTGTTVYNSQSTIIMYFYGIYYRKSILEAAKDLGFVVKYHSTSQLGNATFLKGWWCASAAGWRWMPLPSLSVKVGKVMRPPETIVEKRDRSKALAIVSYAIGRSFGDIDARYPILGALLYKLRELGTEGKIIGNLSESKYKPLVKGDAQLDMESVYDKMEGRYGVPREFIREAHDLIMQTKELPTLVCHPFFPILANRDYA